MLDVDVIRKEFSYDEVTGQIIRVKTGNAVGFRCTSGYTRVDFMGRRIAAHRLAWAFVNGEWPTHEIDHINGIKSDNRLVNLRDVSRSTNAQNLRHAMPRRLRDAPLGVSWHRAAKRWRAMIWDGSKNLYLGLFDDPNEAHEIYLEAKRKLHVGCVI